MAVVWLILKILGWVLLGLLALLIAALLVPVTAELCYEQGRFSAALRVLAVRVRLYPRPEKPAKPAKPKRNSPPKAPKPPKAAGAKPTGAGRPSPAKPAQTPPGRPERQQTGGSAARPQQTAGAGQPKPSARPEKTLGDTMDWVLAWARTGGAILRRLLMSFKIHRICIRLPLHRDSAAATALAVGGVYAGLGAGLGALQNVFDLRLEQLDIWPDYTGEQQGQEHFSCKITSHLIIMVIVGIWALLRLHREKLI